MPAFTESDYFLYLRTILPEAHGGSWSWVPWSALYIGSRPPRFLVTAQRKDRATQIAAALGVPDIDLFRLRLEERGNKVQEMFRGAFYLNPLHGVELSSIGSR